MRPEWLQLAALCTAFWTAVALYRGDRPMRFVVGLALGAVLAHLGWALLQLPAVLEHPWALLDVSGGFSVLFVPLGLLLLTPNAAALATLPLALAVARLGCLAAGCCHGPHGEPTPLVEIGGLLGLHLALRRVPERWVGPAVLAGIGLLRLATEPWRAAPPLGDPLVAPAALAAAWVGAAGLWGAGRRLRIRVLAVAGCVGLLACAMSGGPVSLLAAADDAPDYLRYVAFEAPDHTHVLLRWREDQMPIRIYLPPAPAELFPDPDAVTETTRAAVLAWSDVAAPGVPRFQFVDRAGDADVPVNWAGASPSRSIAHVFFDVNLVQHRFGVANLLVTGRYRDGRLATPEALHLVVLHEMGHALGFGGHSPNPEDVMYGFLGAGDSNDTPQIDEIDVAEALFPGGIPPGTAKALSARDRETLRRLYALPVGKRISGARRAY